MRTINSTTKFGASFCALLAGPFLASCMNQEGDSLDVTALDGRRCISITADNPESLFGFYLRNTERDALEVTKVELKNPSNVKLAGARLLPTADQISAVGTASGWPPTSKNKFNWDNGMDVPGAKARSQERYNLIIGLNRINNDESGDVSDVAVHYTVNGKSAHQSFTSGMIVSNQNCDEMR